MQIRNEIKLVYVYINIKIYTIFIHRVVKDICTVVYNCID